MEDIAAKLSELLNSPDGMARIKNAAQQILENNSEKPSNIQATESNINLDSLLSGGLATENLPDIGNIMRIVNLFKNQNQDKRTTLLLALKPHLSKERGQRVDKAISLLKIASLLPVLKQEGLFDLFG